MLRKVFVSHGIIKITFLKATKLTYRSNKYQQNLTATSSKSLAQIRKISYVLPDLM